MTELNTYMMYVLSEMDQHNIYSLAYLEQAFMPFFFQINKQGKLLH